MKLPVKSFQIIESSRINKKRASIGAALWKEQTETEHGKNSIGQAGFMKAKVIQGFRSSLYPVLYPVLLQGSITSTYILPSQLLLDPLKSSSVLLLLEIPTPAVPFYLILVCHGWN